MKSSIVSIISLFVFAAFFVVACNDDEYSNVTPTGEPSVTAEVASMAQMGSSITFSANCSDPSGTALSTLKAELLFSGEVVDNTEIRTAENGSYELTLTVPFLRYIPDGEGVIRLTLTNVSTKQTVTDVKVNIVRPTFDNLSFVSASGEKYTMTATGDNNYSVVIDTDQTAFKGHFETADGAWVFGLSGQDITLGGSGNLGFQSSVPGKVTVSFNTCSYTYAPLEELDIQQLIFSEDDNILTQTFQQNRIYAISGIVNGDWFVDNDFFTDNGDGTFTFNAIDGTYTLAAYSDYQFLQVFAGTPESPATIQGDGTGGLWIIGGEGINKPYLSTSNNHGWWTGTEWDVPVAQISPKVYRITLTVGAQLSASDINFKFFGQPDWGVEFKGVDGDYMLTCDSEIFGIGDGNDGHDNGNIYLKDGAALNDGDTYVFTVDLTAGVANGILKIEQL